MQENTIKLLVRVVLSLALVGVGLYVVIHPDSHPDAQKAAFGWIGLVVGYWLR